MLGLDLSYEAPGRLELEPLEQQSSRNESSLAPFRMQDAWWKACTASGMRLSPLRATALRQCALAQEELMATAKQASCFGSRQLSRWTPHILYLWFKASA